MSYNSYSDVNFLINYQGILYISMKLNVFRTLGLSNCKVINRVGDDSLTVEVNLTDPLYMNQDSKFYKNLHKSVSKLPPTKVIVCCHKSNSIDFDELKGKLDRSLTDFELIPVNLAPEYHKVLLDKYNLVQVNLEDELYSFKFLDECVNELTEGFSTLGQFENYKSNIEGNKTNLESDLEILEEKREIMTKVYNTIKKESKKECKLVKDMIHELNKNLSHSNFKIQNGENNPILRILSFIDSVNLKCFLGNESNCKSSEDTCSIIKLKNGIISNESTFNLFKNSCEVLLKEVGLFIMSIYFINEKNIYIRSPTEDYCDDNFAHILVTKDPKNGEILALFIKST